MTCDECRAAIRTLALTRGGRAALVNHLQPCWPCRCWLQTLKDPGLVGQIFRWEDYHDPEYAEAADAWRSEPPDDFWRFDLPNPDLEARVGLFMGWGRGPYSAEQLHEIRRMVAKGRKKAIGPEADAPLVVPGGPT